MSGSKLKVRVVASRAEVKTRRRVGHVGPFTLLLDNYKLVEAIRKKVYASIE
jgi:hypothetical protein